MARVLRSFWHRCLLGAAIALAVCAPASAGWMGFRNDTKGTIVLQETIFVNGQAKLGRPQQMLTGEVIRDTQGGGGQRTFGIFDVKNPNQPLFSGNFGNPAANENHLYVIKSDGKGGIAIEMIKTTVQTTLPKKK